MRPLPDPFLQPRVDPPLPEKRDGPFIRYIKMISIIVALTGLGAVIAVLFPYVVDTNAPPGNRKRIPLRTMMWENFDKFKHRAMGGGAAGAAMALVYVGRCLIKREDP